MLTHTYCGFLIVAQTFHIYLIIMFCLYYKAKAYLQWNWVQNTATMGIRPDYYGLWSYNNIRNKRKSKPYNVAQDQVDSFFMDLWGKVQNLSKHKHSWSIYSNKSFRNDHFQSLCSKNSAGQKLPILKQIYWEK